MFMSYNKKEYAISERVILSEYKSINTKGEQKNEKNGKAYNDGPDRVYASCWVW